MTHDQNEAERFLCEADSLLNTFAKANGLTFHRLTVRFFGVLDGWARALTGKWGENWLIVYVSTPDTWAAFEQVRVRYYLLSEAPKDFGVCNKPSPLRTIVRGADDLLATITRDLMRLRDRKIEDLLDQIIDCDRFPGIEEVAGDPDNEPTEPDDKTPK